MIEEQYVWSWIATGIEVCIAIIGACLPTLVPVYRFLFGGRSASQQAVPRYPQLKSLVTFGRMSSRDQALFSAAQPQQRGSFNQLHSLEALTPHGYANEQQTVVNGGARSRASSSDDVPPNSIRIKHDLRQEDGEA